MIFHSPSSSRREGIGVGFWYTGLCRLDDDDDDRLCRLDDDDDDDRICVFSNPVVKVKEAQQR